MTHVALPPAFVLGSPDPLMAQAARHYNMLNRNPPSSWGRAAASLGMDAPDPLRTAPLQFASQEMGKPTAGRTPPPPFLDKSTSIVSLRGAPSIPPPADTSTSVVNPRPHSAPSADISAGYGKSHPLVKTPSTTMMDASCPRI